MARITYEYCRKCEAETHHNHGKCTPCNDRQERERIAKWNALTANEKIQDLRMRIEKIERGRARYA